MIELIQSLYNTFSIDMVAGAFDVAGFGSVLFILLANLNWLFVGDKTYKQIETITEKRTEEVVAPEPKVKEVPEVPWEKRLEKGMAKSRNQLWSKLTGVFATNTLSSDVVEEIEETLYAADLGPSTTQKIIDELESKVGTQYSLDELKLFIKEMLKDKLSPVQQKLSGDLFKFDESNRGKTKVIMIVGVNGAGKTTTIGKLATKLQKQGAKVVVGACDTFRAAAVDQLQVWCDRAGCEMVRAKDGADPSGVGYDALQKAINMQADYCLLDTAGRLHTKSNLMDELGKSKRVLAKLDDSAPHEVLLVIDAITGQNAIRQAQEFNQALGLTGLIFTKCDGSSKAGSAVSIVDQLQVPISYIGVGENVEDLNVFEVEQYLDAMLH